MLIHLVAHLSGFVTAITNPAPVAPPGSEMILKVVGYLKWAAGLALLAGFFGGLLVFAGGRVVDHHRAGRIGTVMILASLFGGILYGVGYTMISTFAGSS
jgi:hypothetical protein